VGHVTGSHFEDAGGAVGGSGDTVYETLHVVALRLDPCFASLAPDPHGQGCQAQLRLVFQEVTDIQGEPVAFDSAVHAFYALSRSELLAFARAVVDLRVARGGGARLGELQPHPIMVREGLGGPFASGIRALVLQYAGAQNLTRITRMSSSSVFTWSFDGFDVTDAADATYTRMPIPALPSGTQGDVFGRNFGADVTMQGQFEPEPDSPDDFAVLANAPAAAQLTDAERQQAFDRLVRVENPTVHSADTIDCVSCHLAMPVASLVITPTYGLVEQGNPNAFAPDARFVLPGEMAAAYREQFGFNVHAFSYDGQSPGINQRVVNETAAVVDYLNTLP
jgi:hypothetical protein